MSGIAGRMRSYSFYDVMRSALILAWIAMFGVIWYLTESFGLALLIEFVALFPLRIVIKLLDPELKSEGH